MSANDAIYFERGTPFQGVQLSVREDNKTVSKKFNLAVTSKVYEPKTNRYIYQAQLPESMDYGMVDGAAVAFTAQSQGKHEHGGVIPTSAVTFDETDATFFVLRERERVWGTEYYAEECLAAADATPPTVSTPIIANTPSISTILRPDSEHAFESRAPERRLKFVKNRFKNRL